jgi:diguanylate cyclase (GGDEF)-like protein
VLRLFLKDVPVHLIRRSDTSLVVALIAGAVIVFQQPLRWVLDVGHQVELRYHLDLIPALTVLIAAFVFHQYQRRQESRTEARAAAVEAAQARVRSEELQQLMTFSQALVNALDRPSLQQTLCRTLPTFVGDRECWVLTRQGQRWDSLLQGVAGGTRRSVDSLEPLAIHANESLENAPRQGLSTETDICFPLVAGGAAVGVMGILNTPALTDEERHAVGAAAAVVAVAIRNLQLLQELREFGVRDGLTGCFNRAHALEVLQTELQRARRTGRPLSMLMFDIDHFKTINDTSGHLHGDAVLAAVGRQLKDVLRNTDVRCRYGGDEFLVILPDTSTLGAQQVAESLRREIADLRLSPTMPAAVTASVGVTTAPPGELDGTMVIARADEALYRAKRAGRNRCCLAMTGRACHGAPIPFAEQNVATARRA